MQNFDGKTAFITGGASGIGLGMATVFARAGMNIAIADINPDRLEMAKAELKAITDNVIALTVDASQPADIEQAADTAFNTFGAVHVLCNNAGIGGGAKVLETPDDRWRRVHEVNFWGPLTGIKTFLPRMLEQDEEGHIVNTSSFSGIEGHHSQSCYGTSKFALVGLSEYLRNDLEDTKISVSVLCPHVVDTPIFYPDVDLKDKQAVEEKKKTMPWLEQLAVSPEKVGEQVKRAIETDELYIFCDGVDTRAMLKARCEKMLAAMDRQFPETAND